MVGIARPVYDYLRRFEWLRRVYRESRSGYNLVRNRTRALVRGDFVSRRQVVYCQSIPVVSIPFENIDRFEGLCGKANELGLHLRTGKHTVYLPPQEGLDRLLGSVTEMYPPDVGFKVLKNFGEPTKVSYIVNADIRRITEHILGPVTNQALAANTLFALGLGPQCYGVIHLRSGSRDITAFNRPCIGSSI